MNRSDVSVRECSGRSRIDPQDERSVAGNDRFKAAAAGSIVKYRHLSQLRLYAWGHRPQLLRACLVFLNEKVAAAFLLRQLSGFLDRRTGRGGVPQYGRVVGRAPQLRKRRRQLPHSADFPAGRALAGRAAFSAETALSPYAAALASTGRFRGFSRLRSFGRLGGFRETEKGSQQNCV